MNKLKDGFLSSVYHDTDNNSIIKKYHDQKKLNNQKVILDEQKVTKHNFTSEVFVVKKLAEIKNKHVITPKILSIDTKNLSWTQEFVQGRDFYEQLCDVDATNATLRILRGFGAYLGLYHKKNLKNEDTTLLVGDLSAHNLLFTKDKLFVFDPAKFVKSRYIDISKFLLNFLIANPFIQYKMRNRKKQFIKVFLDGYKSVLEIDTRKLDNHILTALRGERTYLKNDLCYRLVKSLYNIYLRYVEFRFRIISKNHFKNTVNTKDI